MADQLQQVVSRPDQGAVVAHPSTLADIEHNRNSFPGRRGRDETGGGDALSCPGLIQPTARLRRAAAWAHLVAGAVDHGAVLAGGWNSRVAHSEGVRGVFCHLETD
jgi:hypothetical protein